MTGTASEPRLPGPGRADIGKPPLQGIRARSSAGEHYLDMVGVTGSIPVAPTSLRLLRKLRLGKPAQASRSEACAGCRVGLSAVDLPKGAARRANMGRLFPHSKRDGGRP